jgi:hypothetical protein
MGTASMTQGRLVLAILMALILFSSSSRAFAARQENDQLTQLLSQARDEAVQLAGDADQTESLIRSQASWETHASMLESVKEHVNNMGRIISKLTGARGSGSELQEQAVDRMLPLLKELAANTSAAINYLNQNRTRPPTDPYSEYLRDNAQTAHQLASTISSLLEYEKTMTQMEKLRSKLRANGV